MAKQGANNNIFVRVLAMDGKKLATPKRMSLPVGAGAIVYDKTNADIPDVSSEMKYYYGGVERVVELDKSAQSIHDLINGATGSESGSAAVAPRHSVP